MAAEISIGNVGTLIYGSARIEKPSAKKVWSESFTFSCSVTDNSDLRSLFGRDGMDVMYRVCGTTERGYPHYPRKMKKALKKLANGRSRNTRLMNKLKIKQCQEWTVLQKCRICTQ